MGAGQGCHPPPVLQPLFPPCVVIATILQSSHRSYTQTSHHDQCTDQATCRDTTAYYLQSCYTHPSSMLHNDLECLITWSLRLSNIFSRASPSLCVKRFFRQSPAVTRAASDQAAYYSSKARFTMSTWKSKVKGTNFWSYHHDEGSIDFVGK